jgi:hypothetical protein
MKTTPIIFNVEMIRAILDGRKTQTRRIVSQGALRKFVIQHGPAGLDNAWETGDYSPMVCPYGQPGDTLWVREAFQISGQPLNILGYFVEYKDGTKIREPGDSWVYDQVKYRAYADGNPKWRPSIHMPRWASRITLDVVSVWIEPLKEITPLECVLEGVNTDPDPEIDIFGLVYNRFQDLWGSIHTKPGRRWENNPWVWVVSFSGRRWR